MGLHATVSLRPGLHRGGRRDDRTVEHGVGPVVLDEPFLRTIPSQLFTKMDGQMAQQEGRCDVMSDLGRLPTRRAGHEK